MKVINLFGSPGSGKSTTAAGLFFLMKLRNINCELVTEFAKKLVWAERKRTFDDQLYLLAKQNHLLVNLLGKVEYAVTDSPILLANVYGSSMSSTFKQLVIETFNSYDNVNFFIKRVKPYNPKGRNQNETESNALVDVIENVLTEHKIPYTTILGDEDAPYEILKYLKL